MCNIATEIYTESRNVAEHLMVLVSRLRHCLTYNSHQPGLIDAAFGLLETRGDRLAGEVLRQVLGRVREECSLPEVAGSLPASTASPELVPAIGLEAKCPD